LLRKLRDRRIHEILNNDSFIHSVMAEVHGIDQSIKIGIYSIPIVN